VVDHHHPDPDAVEQFAEHHVNPYLHDEDYRITTGMMCVEIARMIDPDVTDELRHVPAVAGIADRSEGEAMDEYLELAAEEGYEAPDLRDIGEALDYATYWLRYNDGREYINDLLNVKCDHRDRHERVVNLHSERPATSTTNSTRRRNTLLRKTSTTAHASSGSTWRTTPVDSLTRHPERQPARFTTRKSPRLVTQSSPSDSVPTSQCCGPTASVWTSRRWSQN
jgi:RecJ-like exonuclease